MEFSSTDVLSGLSSPRKSWIFADSVVQFLVLCVGLKVAQRVVFISALLSRRKVGVRNKLELQNSGKTRLFIVHPDALLMDYFTRDICLFCVILPISYGLKTPII